MRIVIALGGNALLRRGQPMSDEAQRENVSEACDQIAPIALDHELVVSHGNGLFSMYAHQSRFGAEEGQAVEAGEVIGYVGSTGRSTGPHLHFETRVNGSARNPMAYF